MKWWRRETRTFDEADVIRAVRKLSMGEGWKKAILNHDTKEFPIAIGRFIGEYVRPLPPYTSFRNPDDIQMIAVMAYEAWADSRILSNA